MGRLEELSALHEISKSMQTLNLHEILHLVLEGVTKAIGFDRARLYLINLEKNILECNMTVGMEGEKIEGIHLPLDKENSMVARSVIERESFIIRDAITDKRVNKKLKELFKLKSFAVVPLRGRDKVLGAVTADNLVSDRIITPEKFESLVTFANQAGLALENATMYEELKSFTKDLEKKVDIASDNLKKTQEKLIQSEKLAALGKLSAGIAHEIRNPLTSIRVLIHSLSEDIAGSHSRKKDLEVIEEEIERVNQIIQRFLDFARPQEPKLSSIDITHTLEETMTLTVAEARERNIDIKNHFGKVPHIEADKEQMKQVFLNLLLNAFQAMPEGGQIELVTSKDNSSINIEIKDNGTGVANNIKERLFEPFFTTKEEGIGLGLSIVKRIIEAHGGSIKVDDNQPQGAKFIIALPMRNGGLANHAA